MSQTQEAIPAKELVRPLMQAIYEATDGTPDAAISAKEVFPRILELTGVPNVNAWGMYENGKLKTPLFVRRVGFAFKSLKAKGLGVSPQRSHWGLTESGITLFKEDQNKNAGTTEAAPEKPKKTNKAKADKKKAETKAPPEEPKKPEPPAEKDCITNEHSSIYLRKARKEDAAAFVHFVTHPDVSKNFENLHHQITTEDEERWIEEMVASETDDVYAVISKDKDRVVGVAGLHEIYKPARHARIGLIIGHENMGYGQQALEALFYVGFENHGLNKLWVKFFRTNLRMYHLTNKFHFRQEGVLFDEYTDHEGNLHDMVRLALLKRDYDAQ